MLSRTHPIFLSPRPFKCPVSKKLFHQNTVCMSFHWKLVYWQNKIGLLGRLFKQQYFCRCYIINIALNLTFLGQNISLHTSLLVTRHLHVHFLLKTRDFSQKYWDCWILKRKQKNNILLIIIIIIITITFLWAQ